MKLSLILRLLETQEKAFVQHLKSSWYEDELFGVPRLYKASNNLSPPSLIPDVWAGRIQDTVDSSSVSWTRRLHTPAFPIATQAEHNMDNKVEMIF